MTGSSPLASTDQDFPSATPQSDQTVHFEPTSTPTITPFPAGYNPLTGLEVSNPNILNRRPVMIKVANFPRTGRPHAGLSYADIVFEYYIGEMFNRFLAVFYGQDSSQIGPIRSGRLVDAQLAQMYQGILVYGNADVRVDEILNQQLGNRSIASKDSPCPPVCGADTHSVVGVFADSRAVSDFALERDIPHDKPDLTGMRFSVSPRPGELKALEVAVQYATIDRGEWRYDEKSGKYLRWVEEENDRKEMIMVPMVDRVNGRRISFSNILILKTFYIEYNSTLHNVDLWNNQGHQAAYLFRDGVMIEGKWKTLAKDKPIHFFRDDGSPLSLKPGNTWIVLAGQSSTFEEKNKGNFELLFYLP